MAQRSTGMPVTSEDVERLSAADQVGVSPQVLGEPIEDTKDPIQKTKQAMESGLAQAKDSLRAAQSKVSDSTEDAMRRFRTFAEEHPFHLLAIIAGAAFAVGVGLRIWRSSRYE